MSMNTPKPCFAISAEANFEEGTWTFNPIGKYSVGAGRYAILREAEYLDLAGHRDELLNIARSVETALAEGYPASEVLDENSPLRDALRAATAKAEAQ